ncbi:hypothetical protein [Paraglaciecola aestuariivivens]
MNRKSKSLFRLVGLPLMGMATLAFLTLPSSYSSGVDAFCKDLPSIALDKNLPVSHPKNKCASQQMQGVSWFSWVAGRSSSYQFHFIDLLELLSRPSESVSNNPTQSK